MPTGRTRFLALAITLAALAFAPAAAAGVPNPFVFPVVGKASYTNDWGDPRWQGSHQGNDLMAKRFTYAVAAERGRVEIRSSGTAPGYTSCYIFLYGRSGTSYWYIHLNNDKPGRPANDNEGGCRAGISWPKGLRSGETVRAGQLIGFVGNSGDANGTDPHLHFELRPNGGGAVNPYRHLNRARRLIYAAPPSATSVALRMHGTVVAVGERLEIRTRVVRVSTGKFFAVSRRVAVDLPEDVVVQRRSRTGAVRSASLAKAEPGDRVVVWTKSAGPTLANQRALPGTWDAQRVLYD